MTQTDVGYFDDDTVEDEANAQVTAGEVLTERQLLEGCWCTRPTTTPTHWPGGRRWDSGLRSQMNRFAALLGMDHTTTPIPVASIRPRRRRPATS